MDSRLQQVVNGYAQLGSYLVQQWSAQATTVATRLDGGSYTADLLVQDVVAGARLAGWSAFLMGSEALDATAIITGRQADPHIVDSEPFAVPFPGATFTATEPLIAIGGTDSLPTRAISFVSDDKQFRVRADATGHQGSLYRGKVQATAGSNAAQVDVFVIVP